VQVGSLSAQTTGGRGGGLLEVTAQGRREEVAEDEIGTPGQRISSESAAVNAAQRELT
jgi:hypothetical protein